MGEIYNLDLYFDFIHQFPNIPNLKCINFILFNQIFTETIFKYLTIKDMMNLAATCRYFQKICLCDRIWLNIYEKYFKKYSEMIVKSDFFKVCKEIYMESYMEPELKLLVEEDKPIGFFTKKKKNIYTGTVHKKRYLFKGITKKFLKENDEKKTFETFSCTCIKCSYSTTGLKSTPSMTNLYQEDDSPYNSTDISSDTELQEDTKVPEVMIKSNNNSIADVDDDDDVIVDDKEIVPSKEELKRRLTLLIKHAMKHPIEFDNFLPGDKTTNYALK